MRRGDNLLILGASTRAAAMSAIRAGFRPWCADLFADEDLRRICAVERLAAKDYPQGFVEIARRAPPGSWMYTGGLENHPRVVEQISRQRTLLGTKAAVLRKVRSPFVVAQHLKKWGVPCPAVARSPGEIPAGGRWLIKPRRSSGGRGIRFWTGGELPTSGEVYFQEFIDGEPISAVFASSEEGPFLYGETRQLIGQPWLHAAPFHYCGSIGHLDHSTRGLQALTLVTWLAERFHLRGLFGIDCVLRDEVLWPIEINPRYTASVEVLERSTQLPALLFPGNRQHANFLDFNAPFHGKAILYAKAPLVFPADGPWMEDLAPSAKQDPSFADIPRPGEAIEKGRPILTFFATARTVADCEKRLREIAGGLDALLFGS